MAVIESLPNSTHRSWPWVATFKDVCVRSAEECYGASQRDLRCRALRNLTGFLEFGLTNMHVFAICDVTVEGTGGSILRIGSGTRVNIEVFTPDIPRDSVKGRPILDAWCNDTPVNWSNEEESPACGLTVHLLGIQNLGPLMTRGLLDRTNLGKWTPFYEVPSTLQPLPLFPAPLYDPSLRKLMQSFDASTRTEFCNGYSVCAQLFGTRTEFGLDPSDPPTWEKIVLGNESLEAAAVASGYRQSMVSSNVYMNPFMFSDKTLGNNPELLYSTFGSIVRKDKKVSYLKPADQKVLESRVATNYVNTVRYDAPATFTWTPPENHTWLNVLNMSSQSRLGTAGGGEGQSGCRGTAQLALVGPKVSGGRGGDRRYMLAEATVHVDLCGQLPPTACLHHCKTRPLNTWWPCMKDRPKMCLLSDQVCRSDGPHIQTLKLEIVGPNMGTITDVTSETLTREFGVCIQGRRQLSCYEVYFANALERVVVESIGGPFRAVRLHRTTMVTLRSRQRQRRRLLQRGGSSSTEKGFEKRGGVPWNLTNAATTRGCGPETCDGDCLSAESLAGGSRAYKATTGNVSATADTSPNIQFTAVFEIHVCQPDQGLDILRSLAARVQNGTVERTLSSHGLSDFAILGQITVDAEEECYSDSATRNMTWCRTDPNEWTPLNCRDVFE